MIRLDGLDGAPEFMAGTLTDMQILQDWFTLHPEYQELWKNATDAERAQFLEERRGDPRYSMSAEDFAAYVGSQQAAQVAQSAAGTRQEQYRIAPQKAFPWLMIGALGLGAYWLGRRRTR